MGSDRSQGSHPGPLLAFFFFFLTPWQLWILRAQQQNLVGNQAWITWRVRLAATIRMWLEGKV